MVQRARERQGQKITEQTARYMSWQFYKKHKKSPTYECCTDICRAFFCVLGKMTWHISVWLDIYRYGWTYELTTTIYILLSVFPTYIEPFPVKLNLWLLTWTGYRHISRKMVAHISAMARYMSCHFSWKKQNGSAYECQPRHMSNHPLKNTQKWQMVAYMSWLALICAANLLFCQILYTIALASVYCTTLLALYL